MRPTIPTWFPVPRSPSQPSAEPLSAIALSLAAGRAALTEMLTEDAFAPPNLARDWPTGYETSSASTGCPRASHKKERTRTTRSPRRLPTTPAPPAQPIAPTACTNPRLPGQPRNLGVRLVARPYRAHAHTESDIDTYLELIVEFVTTATT